MACNTLSTIPETNFIQTGPNYFLAQPTEVAVILMIGNFNPITHNHVRLMQVAKDYLESENMSVARGIFSIPGRSLTNYGLAPSYDREYMLKVSTDHLDWVRTDTSRAHSHIQESFHDAITRLIHTQNTDVQQQYYNPPPTVKYFALIAPRALSNLAASAVMNIISNCTLISFVGNHEHISHMNQMSPLMLAAQPVIKAGIKIYADPNPPMPYEPNIKQKLYLGTNVRGLLHDDVIQHIADESLYVSPSF